MANVAHVTIVAVSVLAVSAIAEPAARAESLIRGSQFHFRTGPFSGSFSGPTSGSISVPMPVDLDYESFTSSKGSFGLRTIIAFDQTQARMAYFFAGINRRFYFWSNGIAFDNTEGGSEVKQQPKMRYYAGFDVGIAHVLVKTFGPVLEAGSSVIDFGGCVGAIYQLGQKTGLEAHLGKTMGMGFSSVSVGSSTMRMFVGLSYLF